MLRHFGPAFRLLLLLTVLTGIVYPLMMTGLCQALFPRQANGSLVVGDRGEVIGSALIGQRFTGARYFHSRPSAAGGGYDATASGGSNLSPTSRQLMERIRGSVVDFGRENPAFHGAVPVDMVTASGSGLDPDISVAAAAAQAARVASARGVDEAAVARLIAAATEKPQLGFLGEARVNVLRLNLDLDQRFRAAPRP